MTKAREVGHRITVSLVALSLFCVGLLDPYGHGWALLHSPDGIGVFISWSLAAMAVVSLLDVVINDVLSERYTLHITQQLRTLWYMLQAMLNMGVVGAAVKTGQFSWILSTYAVLAFSSTWIASFDVWHRYIEPRQSRAQ